MRKVTIIIISAFISVRLFLKVSFNFDLEKIFKDIPHQKQNYSFKKILFKNETFNYKTNYKYLLNNNIAQYSS